MIIGRYIISEVVKPAAAILTVLVAVFASYCAVTYLADAVGGVLSAGMVGRLVALKIGMALETLLPTTLYLSVIIALGRLYKDSEMTALAASGVGIGGVLKPVLLLSLPIALLTAGASLYLRPMAYTDIYRLRAEARAALDISRLEADHFLEAEGGRLAFFAEDLDDKSRSATKVFIRARKKETLQVINAEKMVQAGRTPQGQPVMVFQNGSMVEFPLSGQGGNVTRFGQAVYQLAAKAQPTQRYRRKAASTEHLLNSDRLEDVAELQWRLSTPLSTILLALLGVPLSRTNPRKGKYARMGVALILFAVYYQLFVIAKTWVEKGVIAPLPGIWWVPALMATAVLFLLYLSGEVVFRR